MGRRETEPGAVPGVLGYSGPSHVRCLPVRAVPLAAVIPSRVPGRGRGAWGGPRQRSGQAGSIKGVPRPQLVRDDPRWLLALPHGRAQPADDNPYSMIILLGVLSAADSV